MSHLLLQTNFDGSRVMPEAVTESWQQLGSYMGLAPQLMNVLGGIVLLIIGYFVAKFVGKLVAKLLSTTGIDDKTKSKMSLSKFIGKIVYYVLMVIVLMITLSVVGVSGDVLNPLNEMVTKFFQAVPSILAAFLIAYVGYFLAKIVSELVEASGDKIKSWLPKDFNMDKSINVVAILKNLAFIFIFVPILIIALEKLNMAVITEPATGMLSTFINAIPFIIYAIVILLVAVIGGRFITKLLKELLNGFKVNELGRKLQIENVLGKTNLVSLIANLAYIFIIYIGIIEAARQLGLMEIVDVLDDVLYIAGNVVFGLIILSLGNVVANFAAKIFSNSKNANKMVASIIRVAILFIFLAMGLHAMGIANDIIELAFGLSLGAVAVAFALSFGLGGREAAGKEMSDFFSKMKRKNNDQLNK